MRLLENLPPDPLQHSLHKALSYRALKLLTIRKPLSVRRPDEFLQRLVAGITHRTTSRPGGETICIATMAGIDPTPLLQAPVQERMHIFLILLPCIPRNIVFALGPRL